MPAKKFAGRKINAGDLFNNMGRTDEDLEVYTCDDCVLAPFLKTFLTNAVHELVLSFLGNIDVKFYERFSSLFYLLSLILLVCLFLFGKRVNGALSWFPIGSFNLQPSEFVKITVALAVSKYISDYQTDLRKISDQAKLLLIILIPILSHL